MMDLSRLEILKKKLVNAKEFADVLIYFMDHFGEDPDFIELGGPVRNSIVETALAQVVGSMVHKNVQFASLLLIRVAEARFIHGSFHAKGGFGSFIFFEEINMGMAAGHFEEHRGQTLFARFSAMPLIKPSNTMVN